MSNILCICDLCKQDKPREFSYFTDRMWYCEDCKPVIEHNKHAKTGNMSKNTNILSREDFYEKYEL